MTGLARPTSGEVRLDGRDPVREPDAKRRAGVVAQTINLDQELTVAQNLDIHGRLFGLPREVRQRRSRELLGQFGLESRAGDQVCTLSGGLRRRVMRLTASGLSFSRDGRPILRDVGLCLAPGRLLVVAGPNGVGKTTLIRLLLGLLPLEAGTIRLEDRDLTRLSRRELAKAVAYVPQGGTPTFPMAFGPKEGRRPIEALVKLSTFFLGREHGQPEDGKQAAGGVELFTELNVPVFQPVVSTSRSLDEWRADPQGLGTEIAWMVAMTGRESWSETAVFPFTALAGQDEAKLALTLAVICPALGGVLLRGEKGTAKSTLARGLAALLPKAGFPGGFVDLPLSVGEDRLAGCIDLEQAIAAGRIVCQPGLLARADGGVLYVDEINLLPDHITDMYSLTCR